MLRFRSPESRTTLEPWNFLKTAYDEKEPLTIIRLALAFSFPSAAQTKQTRTTTQLWGGYFNQARLSNRWGLWLDVHLRTKEDLVQDLAQGILRGGLTYYLDNAWRWPAG